MKNGTYHTAAGSTLELSGEHGGRAVVEFDWLEEGGCCDCVPIPYPDHGELTWTCDECGGGHAVWIPDA